MTFLASGGTPLHGTVKVLRHPGKDLRSAVARLRVIAGCFMAEKRFFAAEARFYGIKNLTYLHRDLEKIKDLPDFVAFSASRRRFSRFWPVQPRFPGEQSVGNTSKATWRKTAWSCARRFGNMPAFTLKASGKAKPISRFLPWKPHVILNSMKNKELISIIKSGLVGALGLTGISFILSIASKFTYWWMGWLLYIFFLSIPFPKTVFAVMGSIGFILGLLLRRRFPIIQRGVLPLMIALVMLIVALGWRSLLIHKMWMDTELPPVHLKLADCTNNVVQIHLKIPAGHDYQLDLETPGTQVSTGGATSSSYNFSGHLHISSNGSLITDLPIGSNKAWRNDSGYGLTGAGMQNTNVPPLGNFIQSHKNYDFEISFEPPPPAGSSIWFYCLVSVKDRDK